MTATDEDNMSRPKSRSLPKEQQMIPQTATAKPETPTLSDFQFALDTS